MDGAPMLDSLIEVFPQVNVVTLIEASMDFKGNIEAAADYVIQNVLPNMVSQPSEPNANEDSLHHGLEQQASDDDTNNHLRIDPVDNRSNSDAVQTYLNNEIIVKQLSKSSTDLSSEASTSSGGHISEGFGSDSLLQHSSSEANTEISASEVGMSQHDNDSPDMIMRSNYYVNIFESLDGFIADEQHKKVTLLSNAASISEMLQEVDLSEEKTKHAISAVSQAGNDILRKADEVKEIATLVMDDNDKMAGEIFAENSILATEAHELQTRLFNISEETKSFELTIGEMQSTLQKRLAACEEERAAAEKAKLEREASAQKILTEQRLSLEAATKRFRWLEQQAKENVKLKESLVDRGNAVDALQGEMLGIFDRIIELKRKVDMKFPVEEPLEPSLPSSAIFYQCDESLQQVPSSLSSSPVVDVPLQPVSSDTLVKSASSKSGSIKPLSSWFSLAESSSKEDEKIAVGLSEDNFSLDDSWDVVSDEDEELSPKRYATPVQL